MKISPLNSKIQKKLSDVANNLDQIFKECEKANNSDHKILIMTEQLYCEYIRPLINLSLKLINAHYRHHQPLLILSFQVQEDHA